MDIFTSTRSAFCVWFMLMATVSVAQQVGKEKRSVTENSKTNLTNRADPYMEPQKMSRARAKKRGKSAGPTYNSEKDFADRMEARVKTYRKNERMLMTPQYSNPMYFGHKSPPKKTQTKQDEIL